ncbi:MAG: rRNA maturation RNase YbeY [Ahrensia sp.]|nr:rRNA maturation RNase YbeY [Ahrensia sp.]
MMIVDCSFVAGDWPDECAVEELAQRAIEASIAGARLELPTDAEVSVVFADDAQMRSLNRQWRERDKPTNVLTFAANDADGPFSPLLGDIVLASETIAREAREQGKSFEAHLTHLIIHGFLHLNGHDHLVEAEALAMERLETEICAELGIADPHAAH